MYKTLGSIACMWLFAMPLVVHVYVMFSVVGIKGTWTCAHKNSYCPVIYSESQCLSVYLCVCVPVSLSLFVSKHSVLFLLYLHNMYVSSVCLQLNLLILLSHSSLLPCLKVSVLASSQMFDHNVHAAADQVKRTTVTSTCSEHKSWHSSLAVIPAFVTTAYNYYDICGHLLCISARYSGLVPRLSLTHHAGCGTGVVLVCSGRPGNKASTARDIATS